MACYTLVTILFPLISCHVFFFGVVILYSAAMMLIKRSMYAVKGARADVTTGRDTIVQP